jgi:hypothetical protein
MILAIGTDRSAQPNAPPRAARTEGMQIPGNVGYLFALGGDEYVELHGVPFRVPPVPALQGARLYELKARIVNTMISESKLKLTAQEHAEYAATIQQLARCMEGLLRPVRKPDKIRRALGIWRPLQHATDAELGQLLDFLLGLRAKSVIRFRPGTARN